MTEQIKFIDYKARKVNYVAKVSDDILNQVLGIVESIMFQSSFSLLDCKY